MATKAMSEGHAVRPTAPDAADDRATHTARWPASRLRGPMERRSRDGVSDPTASVTDE